MTNPPVPSYVPNWNPNTIWNNNGVNQYAYEQGGVFLANYYMQGASNEPIRNYSDPYSNPWTLVSGSVNTSPAAPLAPTGVASSFTSDRLIALSWNPAHVPGTGAVTSYEIFQNGVKIGTSTSNHFTVAGLSGSTGYQFTVDAVDATGVSPVSSVITLTTASPVVSSGKVFSPYIDVGLDVDNDILSIARAMGHNDYTFAFLQNSVLASGTASVAGGVLTVSESKSGSFVSGYDISGVGVTPGTKIVSQIDGTPGKAGHYQLSTSQTVASTIISESTLGWAGTGTIANDGFPAHAELPNIQSAVQTLISQGGVVTISIGGSSGTDPAVAESNFAKTAVATAEATGMTHAQARAAVYAPYAAELQAQYQSVIDRYGVTHLDFDIEGGAVANQDSFVMRDMALRALETANPNLKISYTLPVLPDGLDDNGRSVLAYAKADGLRVDSVNIMAMDYGANAELARDLNGGLMAQDAIEAAKATHAQILAAGLTAKVGITPMLGINDDTAEIFTTANAHTLEAFAAATPWVASLGYWSVARDNDDTGQASLSDSGTPQARWEFSSIFSPIAIAPAKGADVNGDGHRDLVFRDTGSGTIVDWNGAQSGTGVALGQVSASAYEMKIGDFDGDGLSDLVFRSTSNGQVVIWNHGSPTAATVSGFVSTTDYEMYTPDLNGDGKSDLFFRNKANGALVVWDNGDYTKARYLGALGSEWSITTGDLEGDGKTDLVFLSSNSGAIVEWSGGDFHNGRTLGTLGQGWKIVSSSADFDGDGKSDVTFMNTSSGNIVTWTDGDYTHAVFRGSVAANTEVVTGDFNGDGFSDLLFRNPSTGAMTVWDGGVSSTVHQVGVVGTGYQLFG